MPLRTLPTLRSRLLGVIALVLLTGFLTTNLLSFQVSTRTVKQTILTNELPLTSSNIYSEIQADLLRPVFVSSLMSHDTFVQDWLEEGERDESQIRRYLDEIRTKYNVFTAFLVSEKTRRYYHFNGIDQVIDAADPADAWFFRVRDMQTPYEINIDPNAAQHDTITIFINYRILDRDGRFLGAIGVGLTVDTVAKIVSRYSQSFQRGIYFVDRKGQITVRSGNTAVKGDNITQAEGISAIAKDLLERPEGFYEFDADGETMLATARAIPELGWHVIVEQREADALKALWSGFWTNLAIGALIIVITTVLIAMAVNLYQRQLELMASTDKLTGLANRQSFDLEFDRALALYRRFPTPLSLILLDIDHFKRINDTLGHLGGDEAIRTIARLLQGQTRQSDTLCRWGGEEMIILARGCSLPQALERAERLRALVERELASLVGGVTLSAGVAEYQPGETSEATLRRADDALYRAKRNGRNRVES